MDLASERVVVAEVRGLNRPAVLYWAAGILYSVQLVAFRGYVTDDTWIYARFAQNLAHHGQLAFWPGEPIHAATSPLWAALAAVGTKLGAAPIDVLLWSGRICGLFAVLCFVRAALRLLGRGALTVAACLAFATEIWLLRWSASGMETAAAVWWLLIVFDGSYQRSDSPRVGRWALLLGVGFLLRPEAALLALMLGVARWLDVAGKARLRIVLGLLTGPLLWALYAWPTYGHLLPATLQAKSTPLGLEPGRLIANLRVLVTLSLLAVPVVSLLWWPMAVGRLRHFRQFEDSGRWTELAWWGWTAALPLVYLVRDVQLISRYLEMLLPVLPLLVLTTFLQRSAEWPRRWRRTIVVALLVQATASLVLSVGWIAPRSRDFGRSLDQSLGDLSSWIRENTAADDLVAVYDIGYLGAHCGRKILDLGGLVNPGINDLRNQVDDAEILRRGLFLRFGVPAVLVDRDTEANALDGWQVPGYRLVAVLHRTVANLGLSRPDPVVYTLYRLIPTDS